MLTALYVLATLAIGVSTMFRYSVGTGFCILLASSLAVIGAGGSILGMRSIGDAYRVGTPLVGVILLAIAFWLSGKFSVQVFGFALSGVTWTALGLLFGLVWGFRSRPMSA